MPPKKKPTSRGKQSPRNKPAGARTPGNRQGSHDKPKGRGRGPGSRSGKRPDRPSERRDDRPRPPKALPGAEAIADALAETARAPRDGARRGADGPPSHHNKRPGYGTRPGPHKKPRLGIFTTTLWTYPSQHYGERVQGDKNYVGATPSWVVWQLLKRYTKPGDIVVDPMCGSGTTVDVCEDLARRHACSDLAPTRPDIAQADARELPLEDASADFYFIDPPYSNHVRYSDDPACIGKLSAHVQPGEDPAINRYYAAMTQVLIEAHRVMKPGAYMGLYVSDSFKKGKPFMPIGFELFAIMRERFEPIDIISVVRGNEKLDRGNFHKAAEEGNFFLRGFNYLFIMRKPGGDAGADNRDRASMVQTDKPARVKVRGRNRAVADDLARRAKPAFPGKKRGGSDEEPHVGRKRRAQRDSGSPLGPGKRRDRRDKPGSR